MEGPPPAKPVWPHKKMKRKLRRKPPKNDELAMVIADLVQAVIALDAGVELVSHQVSERLHQWIEDRTEGAKDGEA